MGSTLIRRQIVLRKTSKNLSITNCVPLGGHIFLILDQHLLHEEYIYTQIKEMEYNNGTKYFFLYFLYFLVFFCVFLNKYILAVSINKIQL